MNLFNSRFLAIILLIIGEILAIYAEMIAAKQYSISSESPLKVFLKAFLTFGISGGFLISGYILGFSAFKNIWIVTALSVTTILIVEPILAYTIFHQAPTKGAVIGLILGGIGLLATIFE
jgi:hypothetical protein